MLDKVPNLKLIVSHTGGTLPFLAGRLDSCVSGDEHLAGKLKHKPSHYLKVTPLVPLSFFDRLLAQPAAVCLHALHTHSTTAAPLLF